MNVVISCNDNYLIPARTLLESMSAHNNSVVVWLVYDDVSEDNIKVLRHQADEYGWKFNPIRIQERFKDISSPLPCHMHFSKEMYYRLFLPWILPECERVLYLDCDILVRGDLGPLYMTDLRDSLVGACFDLSKVTREECAERLKVKGNYYNSGVLLLQLSLIREQITEEEMLAQIGCISEEFHLVYPDQDIFNVVYDGKIQKIDKKYNYGANTNILHKLKNYKEMQEAVVVHFITSNKPWKNEYCMFYMREYWSYLKKHLTKQQRQEYWKHKPYISTWYNIVKNFVLRRIGRLGYTDNV